MTGLTSIHVNRTLQALRQDRIVELHSRQIHILDWARLARIGDFDSAYLRLAEPGRNLQACNDLALAG